MKYYITIVPMCYGTIKRMVIESDHKMTIPELWKAIPYRNCKACYASSKEDARGTDIMYHYYNTDELILNLMSI